MTKKDAFRIAGAALAGGVIGAGLGMLFAPDKGTETRRKIVDGTKGMVDDVKNRVKEETENLEKMAEAKLHKMRTGEDLNKAV